MSSNQKRLVPRFDPVSPQVDFPAEENKILEFWDQEKIFERSVSERANAEPFVFFEGPPTANGKPGIHHVEARAFKDAIPRYQTMRGKRVERKAGWDTHGLPVELQVEKALGISGKPEIENIVPGDKHASIAKFNQLCKESVWQYKTDWEKLTKRMGFWVDLEHPYITYETDYVESVWWVLKQLWEKGLLYEDFKVVPYCPRCGTALSSHEVAQGYEDTTDRSVYIKFKVKNQANTYLLAWTTTPWTLPGNVALAVGKDVKYGIYEDQNTNARYILADERAADVFGSDHSLTHTPIELSELTSLVYEPLFDIPSLVSDKSYKVYEADFVTTEDGTGIVHTAVMYGEDDFKLGNAVGLPKHHTVDSEGKFTAEVADFVGMFVKEETTEQKLIEYLRDGEALFSERPYTHTYPFCWRCSTPLIYFAKQSWFIRMSSLRQDLLDRNNEVTWVPSHLREGRFGEWLRDVKDWALSRDRFWGTPLPIWRCEGCGEKRCMGSIEDLETASGTKLKDVHRPFIDDVVFTCEACQGTMRRYPEVIDVWFDSGAMPFAQWHYPLDEESKDRVDGGKNYPANYISEAVDQTRGWFYTLLAIATALGRPAPYKSVVSLGHVLDKDGKKMSKSRGNIVDPWEIMDTVGVDALRFYFYSVNQPGEPKKFDQSDVAQVLRKTFLILWNTYSFLAQRMTAGEINTSVEESPKSENVLDQWLIAKTNDVTQTVTRSLDDLDFMTATRTLSAYINELSTWYLKLSRKRDDAGFLPTFAWAMRRVTLLFAPFTPFFADILWQRMRTDEDEISVHLASWPIILDEVDQDMLAEMSSLQTVIELARAERAKAGIKVRQPLASATFNGVKLSQPLIDLAKQELNVHEILTSDGDEISVTFDTELTDELRAEGLAREIARTIQELRKEAKLAQGDSASVIISGEHALSELLKLQIANVERLTSSKISLGSESGTVSKMVETLTISLLI